MKIFISNIQKINNKKPYKLGNQDYRALHMLLLRSFYRSYIYIDLELLNK